MKNPTKHSLGPKTAATGKWLCDSRFCLTQQVQDSRASGSLDAYSMEGALTSDVKG